MCYVGDPAKVWVETTPKARRRHECCLCELPIETGLSHTCIRMLGEAGWSTYRMHVDCWALSRHIQTEVCGQDMVVAGAGTLRDEVREHYPEAPDLLRRYRAVLRARAREGVWPARAAQGGDRG